MYLLIEQIIKPDEFTNKILKAERKNMLAGYQLKYLVCKNVLSIHF